MNERICIGIPCYRDVAAETLEDYMRFAFHLGRRMPEWDFATAIKTKSEQFRARNAIVEAALAYGAKYLLFLDDDQVIAWDDDPKRYVFLEALIAHMQLHEGERPAGIVGAMYYHRGGECRPVLMKKGTDGGYYYMRDDEVENGLQSVAVTGGGCMLVDMAIFEKVPYPWFEPELELGTDLQICQKASAYGFEVMCDTSIVVGHVKSAREVVTPLNRHRIIAESAATQSESGVDVHEMATSAYRLYRLDALDYLQIDWDECVHLAGEYQRTLERYGVNRDELHEHYKKLGKIQLARQVVFHASQPMQQQMEMFLGMINTNETLSGLDFGCGSAPIGFELAMRGHNVDFVDIEGTFAYAFTKWRAEKRLTKWGDSIAGPNSYHYSLLMDVIEHLHPDEWQGILETIVEALRPDGVVFTNYFLNQDFDNVEHINMDHDAVKEFFTERGVYPVNEVTWIKRDMAFMDAAGSARG